MQYISLKSARWTFILVVVLLVAAACQSSAERDQAAARRRAVLEAAAESPGAAPAAAAGEAFISPAKGGAAPKVRIFEISGFQCPFCARGAETMRQVLDKYGDDVQLVFKHNPLPFHQNGIPAAIASLAAHRQGKFWEMHAKLFEDTRALSDERYRQVAREIGLDMEQFEQDLADPALKTHVERDQGSAIALGASGTPAFFINGVNISGAQPLDKFVEVIDAELAKADKLLAEGVPRAAVAERATERNEGTDKLVDYWYRGRTPPPPPAAEQPAARPDAPKPPPVDTETVWNVVVRDDDPMKGPADALVTIVEFSNFQCPFCSRVGPVAKQVIEAYGDRVRFVFKNYPLAFHKDAPLAAEAALAAHAQGKFWEMHDLIFADQKSLTREVFEGYAEQIGLDMERFRRELDEGTYTTRVQEDVDLAGQLEVRGTPTLFVNGRLAAGMSLDDLKPQIDAELKRAEALLAAGTPRAELYDRMIRSGRRALPLAREVKNIDITGAATLGPPEAPVTIVKFSEFECPFCTRVGGPLKQVVRHYGGRVRVVFKHFPLNFHRHAQLAAEAALAAHAQGRFWEMHDVMFQNQKALTRADLELYAEALGLDMTAFKNDLDRRRFRAQVAKDMADGRKVGVRGTPTLFINGRQYSPSGGGYTAEAIIKVIDEHILAR